MPQSTEANLLSRLDRALMIVERFTSWLGGFVIFCLMFVVTAEVVLRRLFNSPIPGQQDITVLSMVAFGVLCISHCYRQAGHIRMDILLKATKGRLHWSLCLLITLIVLLTISAIWPGTWNHFLRAYNLGDTTFGIGLSTWPSKLAVSVGLALLWVRLVLEVWVYGRLVRQPDLTPIGVPSPADPTVKMDA